MGYAVMSNLYIKVCASCAKNVIAPDSIIMDTIGTMSSPDGSVYPTRSSLPTRYTVRILYTMRPVVRAFSTNDREKNDNTSELNALYAAGEVDGYKLGYIPRHAIEIPSRDTLASEYFNPSCAD